MLATGDDEVEQLSPNKAKHELMLAEMEVRLRAMITELTGPILKKSAMQGSELSAIRQETQRQSVKLSEIVTWQSKAVGTRAVLDEFREDMTKMDTTVHQSLTQAVDDTRTMQVHIDGLKLLIEQKDADIALLQRSIERNTADLERMQDQLRANSEEMFVNRLTESRKQVRDIASEMEVKLMKMEMKHNALTDQMWGEETSTATIAGEIQRANGIIGKLREDVQVLQSARVKPEHLARLREEVHAWLRRADADVAELKRSVGSVVNDVKEHLRTGLETAAHHNATFVEGVRESYRAEIKKSEALREDVNVHLDEFNKKLNLLDGQVAELDEKSSLQFDEHRVLFDEFDQRRRRDRSATDIEMKHVHKRLTSMSDGVDVLVHGLETVGTVSGIILDVLKMQNVLDIQDNRDRDSFHLMGLRDQQKQQMLKQSVDGQSGETPRPSPRRAGVGRASNIMSVDNRCLSCSAEAPIVLQTFKVACLQYNASPVAFGEKLLTRADMLTRMSGLVDKATTRFNSRKQQKKEAAALMLPPRVNDSDSKDEPGAGSGSNLRLPSIQSPR